MTETEPVGTMCKCAKGALGCGGESRDEEQSKENYGAAKIRRRGEKRRRRLLWGLITDLNPVHHWPVELKRDEDKCGSEDAKGSKALKI